MAIYFFIFSNSKTNEQMIKSQIPDTVCMFEMLAIRLTLLRTKTTPQDIFQLAQKDIAENRSISIVFDLDSTLFNVSTRTLRIIKEFAAFQNNQDLQKRLSAVQVHATDWGLKESFQRSGLSFDEYPEKFIELRDFWVERFFSNEYLHYDTPTHGAVAFTQKFMNLFQSHKPKLSYLTGRDEHRMGLGTREVLNKWCFPAGEVVLKPHRDLDDAQFKFNWTQRLVQENPASRIYFFENEPVNLNLIGGSLPDVRLFFLDTTHSRREEVSVPVFELNHFGDLD